MKRIVGFAISHTRTTLLVMLTILVFGIVARLAIPIENEPKIDIPTFIVTVPHEGISPDDALRLLVAPLETELKSVDNIKEVSGVGAEHMAAVIVEFTSDVEHNFAKADLREAVNRAIQNFPSTADEPIISERGDHNSRVVQVNLVGKGAPEALIYQTAREFKSRLEALESVRDVSMQGAREEFLEIAIDPAQMHRYRLSAEQLIVAINRNNRLIPAGSLQSGQGSLSINIPSVVEDPEDLLDVPIFANSSTVITLGDVAKVRRTFKDRVSYAHANGEQSISLFVYRSPEAFLIDASYEVKDLVEVFQSEVPPTIRVFMSSNYAVFAERLVTELEGNIVTALVLVMVVVLATMGFRSSVVVGVAIPISFLFALIFLWLSGQSFNFMVMFGMLLCLGMLIDGVIVIAEDADRRLADGVSSAEAYTSAASRMANPVITSTLTTLAVFFPLLFWPGSTGAFLGYLPKTVLLVMVGALLYSIVLAPALANVLMRNRPGRIEAKDSVQLMWNVDLSRLRGFKKWYVKVLAFSVRHAVITVVLALFSVFAIFTVHGSMGLGVIFLNENQPQYVNLFVKAQGNFSAEEAYSLVSQVEAELVEVIGLKDINMMSTAGLGQAEGTRTEFSGGGSSDVIGLLFVEMLPSDERERTGNEILEEIRVRTSQISGIIVEVVPFLGTLTADKPIAIQFTAEDRNLLELVVLQVREYMLNQVEGLTALEDTLPLGAIEWELNVDRAKAALYGADVTTVGLATQLLTTGVKLGEYRPDNAEDALDIRVRYPSEHRGLEALQGLEVMTSRGPIPIHQFVERTPRIKSDALQRRDQSNMHMIRAAVRQGFLSDNKVNEIQNWIDEQNFDHRVNIRFRGTNEEQEESEAYLSKAFSFALLLMFGLLVLHYNNFYHPFLTMLAIILSTAGVFLGLMITGDPFSVLLSGIGVLTLAGIVVNNNIVLIDTFNAGVKENPDRDIKEIVVLTGLQRLRPVLITTGTTVIGLLPLATDNSIDFINRVWVFGGPVSSYWVPLSQAIMFGLSFATILTLIVTPSLLLLPSICKNGFGKIGSYLSKVLFRSREQTLETERSSS